MMRRLSSERGVTLIEMVIVMLLLGILMAGLSNLFVAGNRASSDAQARIDAQQSTTLAVNRLEFEARCSATYSLLGSGTGIALTMNSQCSHATGTISWCVASGALSRYATADCTGTRHIFIRNVTSSAPFSVLTASGDLPRLRIALTVNETATASDGFTLTDVVAFRNAAPTP
jgi:prepilin-type N-terminal cleavage/methylation domain-containing protein